MTAQQTTTQQAQALGRIAAIAEYHCSGLSPTRIGRLASDPRQELAPLIRAYRAQLPLSDALEERMCSAFALIDALPERIDAAAFYHAYYIERAALREAGAEDAL